MFLPLLKEERPTLKAVHSQVLQNIVDRLDKSFQAFFRRCKVGEKPGFPRFRGEHRYDSFCYPQSGFAVGAGEIYSLRLKAPTKTSIKSSLKSNKKLRSILNEY